MERLASQTVRQQDPEEFQECFNSTTRGYTMPAFTFEKISPPVSGPVSSGTASSMASGSVPSGAEKQRGVMVQILDRFVETRVKRTVLDEKAVTARRQPKAPG
jgi:hypothetical protein